MVKRSTVSRERGFTLVELMITVAIIAVLAVLAGVGYVRFIRTAKTGEAAQMITNIKGAQESYRAETLRYYDVSGGGGIDVYFPIATPITGKVPWDTSTSCTAAPCLGFKILNVKADGNVVYRYSSVAGPADGQPKSLDGQVFGTADDPWFVVKARGDTNQDGVDGFFWSSSWNNYIWSKNPDE
jgi:type IV pilus assembly protein PilA